MSSALAADPASSPTDARPERLRLFVALDLPEERRRAIHAWAERELATDDVRIVRQESLHVTVAFLGHHPTAAAQRAAELVREVEPRPVSLTPLPDLAPVPRSRPRLVALGLDSAGAEAIHAELTPRLLAEGLCKRERRPFWPHLTLARARGGKHERGARKTLRGSLPAPPGELLEAFEAVRLALYRSLLRPDGSQYVSLANLDLPPAATAPGAD